MEQKLEGKLRRRIAWLVNQHPNLLMDALLDHRFWPEGINQDEQYRRYGDDDDSFLRVVFSSDGDAWPNVFALEQEGDPTDRSATPRYRVPFFGGGESGRTRQALLILARAIALDNAEAPQHRPRR